MRIYDENFGATLAQSRGEVRPRSQGATGRSQAEAQRRQGSTVSPQVRAMAAGAPAMLIAAFNEFKAAVGLEVSNLRATNAALVTELQRSRQAFANLAADYKKTKDMLGQVVQGFQRLNSETAGAVKTLNDRVSETQSAVRSMAAGNPNVGSSFTPRMSPEAAEAGSRPYAPPGGGSDLPPMDTRQPEESTPPPMTEEEQRQADIEMMSGIVED